MGDGRNETENNSFTKRVGAATYVVNVHFSETDSATLEDRLLHLIRNKEETASWKLAMANRLMAEYEETLAREVAKAKRVLRKKLQEDCEKILRRESVKMSGTVLVLIAAYLAQMASVPIAEKDTIATIPLWFSDRCGNMLPTAEMEKALGVL